MPDNSEDIPPIPPAPVSPAPVEPPPAVAPPAAPPIVQTPAASPPPAPLPPVAPPAVDARPNPYAPPHAAPPVQGGPVPAYAPVPAGPPQGLAVAAMITGIASVVLVFIGFGFLPAVAAVVLGHLAQRRQPYARAFWITGLITGYVGLGISLIVGLFLLIAIIASIASSTGTGY